MAGAVAQRWRRGSRRSGGQPLQDPTTNPIERLHKEVKRRTRVIGIFPTLDSLMRMVGTLLAEQDDEWQVADRRYSSIGSLARVDELEGGEDPTELLAAIA
jgi:hypothetical protein